MPNHHAVLYVGADRTVIRSIIAELEVSYTVTLIERASFAISDSRLFIDDMYRTSSTAKSRAFVLVCGDITVEAEQALLKVLEEPIGNARVVLCVPPEVVLLPTLLSRLQRASGISTEVYVVSPEFIDWNTLPIAGKLQAIEVRLKAKDENWVEAIARGATTYLAQYYTEYPPDVAASLLRTLGLIGTRGASSKLLLEEIALSFSSLAKTR